MICMMMSFVIAEDVSFTGKQGERIDITETCKLSGHPCPSGFECNITIVSSNQSVLVANEKMSTQNNYYLYTLNRTDNVGTYKYNAFCTNGISNGTSGDIFFQITPSGFDRINTGEGISLLISVAIIVLFSIFFFILFLISKKFAFKLSFIVGSALLFIIAIFFTMVIVSENLGGFANLIEGYSTFFYIVGVIAFVGVTFFILFIGWTILQYWKFKRGFID